MAVFEILDDYRFDLHTHSSYSDGTDTPASIARMLKNIDFQGFALSDHDTVVGCDDAFHAAKQHGLFFVPAVEITTFTSGGSVHILAYNIDPDNALLLRCLADIRNSRLNSVEKTVARLSRDYHISFADVLEFGDGFGGENEQFFAVGRPRIADVLVAKGYFSSRGEVFETLFRRGGVYDFPVSSLSPLAAVELVASIGAVSVLAHPAAKRQVSLPPLDNLRLLKNAGLAGIEVFHPENNPAWQQQICQIASDFALVQTGSSDFHGAGKENRLGQCFTSGKNLRRLLSI